MNIVAILFILVLCFITVEIFIPSGLLGIVGAATGIMALVLAAQQYGALMTLGMTVIFAAAIGLSLWIHFVLMHRSEWGRAWIKKIHGHDPMEDPQGYPSLVGQIGTITAAGRAKSTVLVGTMHYDAICDNGELRAGDKVKIIGADAYHLIVLRLD